MISYRKTKGNEKKNAPPHTSNIIYLQTRSLGMDLCQSTYPGYFHTMLRESSSPCLSMSSLRAFIRHQDRWQPSLLLNLNPATSLLSLQLLSCLIELPNFPPKLICSHFSTSLGPLSLSHSHIELINFTLICSPLD